ncbi:hypothetical protein ACGFX2_26830 [Streptomyces goshikiensis]|uniref:hypothetical protein n=1 Tax=Streptomyces goshikiensis TaxID=1942 RepID=UPI00371BB34F
MRLMTFLTILLLGVVTLLVGGGVMALLVRRPAWTAPAAGAFAAMTFMTAVLGTLVAATRS